MPIFASCGLRWTIWYWGLSYWTKLSNPQSKMIRTGKNSTNWIELSELNTQKMNIIKEIRDEIRAVYREPSSRDMTILALLFLVLPGVIGAYLLFWKGAWSGSLWMAVGAFLSMCRLVPPLFRVIYRLWIGFSVILGYFVSRIVLTVIFFLVITPTGLIMRMVGKDPMERKRDPTVSSYWIRKDDSQETSIERYEKQF